MKQIPVSSPGEEGGSSAFSLAALYSKVIYTTTECSIELARPVFNAVSWCWRVHRCVHEFVRSEPECVRGIRDFTIHQSTVNWGKSNSCLCLLSRAAQFFSPSLLVARVRRFLHWSLRHQMQERPRWRKHGICKDRLQETPQTCLHGWSIPCCFAVVRNELFHGKQKTNITK